MILEVKEDIYIRVVKKILGSATVGELAEDFSRDPGYFCPLLNDLAKGKKSSNYHILKKTLTKTVEPENLLAQRASEILSSILKNSADHGGGDPYSILNVNTSADSDEIRERWLILSDTYSKNKNPYMKNRIDNAYETLIDPGKRHSYELYFQKNKPVKIREHKGLEFPSAKIVTVPVLILCFFTFIFYQYYSFSSSVVPEKAPVKAQHSKNNARVISEPDKGKSFAYEHSGESQDNNTSGKSETPTSENSNSKTTGSAKNNGTPLEISQMNGISEDKDEDYSSPALQNDSYIEPQVEDTGNSDRSSGYEDEKKPPVRIDELLTGKDSWTLDFALNYTNIDSTAQSIETIDFPGSGGETITFPVIINRQVDQDILLSSLTLRYGVTDRMEVFGFSSLFADFQRASLGGDSRSDFDFNFNTAGVGATYQVLKEDRYPALIATTSLNLIENTNFGTFSQFSEENGSEPTGEQSDIGINFDDDFKLNYFKTFSVSLSSYYTVDPVVFFLQSRYIQNFKRKNSISIDPGENFSLSPQFFFVVNPYITLNWGVRFSVNDKDRINGEDINTTRTRLSPLFGVSYEVKDDLIVSFDAQYVNDPDFTRTSAGLRLNYNF